MTLKRETARRVVISAGVVLLLGLLFMMLAPQLFALPAPVLPEDNCVLVEGSIEVTPELTSANITVPVLYAVCGCRTYILVGEATRYSAEPADAIIDAAPNWTLISDTCEYNPPPAPALWAADVCEQYYGGYFSADGNLTLDSDKIGEPLYAGPSLDGPWYQLEANGPPWVFTMDQLMAIADWVGAIDYTQVWFKVNDTGTPALLSSMVADRIVRIGDWCPPIMGGPAE